MIIKKTIPVYKNIFFIINNIISNESISDIRKNIIAKTINLLYSLVKAFLVQSK